MPLNSILALFGQKRCDGYTIDYNDPYWQPCPKHGCTTYQTVEDASLCYCPLCRRLIIHND